MSVTLQKGSSPLDLSINLKLALAAAVSKTKVEDEPSVSGYTKDSFHLFEANAIVQYLTKDFAASDATKFEASTIYNILKANKTAEEGEALLAQLPQLETSLSAATIIVFSGAYAVSRKAYPEIAALPEVAEAIKKALAASPQERAKPTNTGATHVAAGFAVNKSDGEILPKEGEENILITSALPYVNNVPHLGNIVGSVLSADIFARFAKSRNINTLFVCGTDEYGTATETKALEEGCTPQELCDKFHKIHKEVYDWFQIGFDHFGRTTTPQQTEIAQDIFLKLHKNGLLESQVMNQLYCPEHKGYLADRYVEGTCPKCQYEDARGDQCDKCGGLLDPFELINPHCKLDNATPIPRESTHIFLKLDSLEPEIRAWVERASVPWTKNSKTITNSWLKEGLNPRCITRDLVWGTPVPLDEFKDKVLYVWFDAPIGYVSITANYTEKWESWWKNPENVDLYQFMGKDNVPFHTVIFPGSQLGTKENWTMLNHLSTTEYLQYEGGKFSKSRGVGVFGNNAKDSGLSPSVWRYYLASVRPETSDSQFSWNDFAMRNNSELLANLGNFVNRIIKFVIAKYNGVIPQFDTKNLPGYETLVKDLNTTLSQYVTEMTAVHERRGLELAMALSARGNQFLQDNKLDNSLYNNTPDKCDAVVGVGLNIVYAVASVIYPFMPETSEAIYRMLRAPELRISEEFNLVLEPEHCIGKAEYLFKRIEESQVEAWRALYGGKQVA